MMLLHIMRNVSLWVASNGVSLVLNNKRLTGIYLKHAVTKSLCNRLASKSSRIFALSVINSLLDVNRTDRREISADNSASDRFLVITAHYTWLFAVIHEQTLFAKQLYHFEC